jgi:hypothetical protein
MAKYEIYIVTTELVKDKLENNGNYAVHAEGRLNELKEKLCMKYDGLTVIDNCTGYWSDNGQLVKDFVQIWQIYTSSIVTVKDINEFAFEIKHITKQKSQLVTVNGNAYFI